MNNDDLKKMITKFVAMAILEADELPFVETAEYVAERLIVAGIGDVKAAEHRAEVAEKALKEFAEYAPCMACPFKYRCDRTPANDLENNYRACFETCLQIVEKELSEERKDEV